MIARQHAAVEAPDRERRALVLAGGGIIGMFYEIGVLAALDYGYVCGQRTAPAGPPSPFSPARLRSVMSCCMRH
jgi:hypothetical protein